MTFEWKKIFIKQRGIWIIFIMVLLKVILTVSNGYDSHYIINQNPDGYSFYINQYKGKLTEKKEQEIKSEYYAVGHATGKLEELSNQWQEGKIDQIQYNSLSRKYYERQKNRAVFNVVYNQYYYAKEAPNLRYIIDGRGWNTLLSYDNPDFLLLLCLIFILTPLFCNEYESGMNALLLSSRNGKYKTGIYKLSAGIILAVGITALFSFIEFICINNLVGLNDGRFPLQSLEFFQNSDYYISMNQAFIIVVLFRILGAMLLAACISILGTFSRKSIITLFLGSVLMFLPYIFLKGNSLLYYLPLPSGLLSGVGYLWGTSYISTLDQSGNAVNMIQFQKIDKAGLGFLLTGYGVETGLLLLCCLKKYSGYTLKFQNLKNRTKMICCCLGMVVVCSIVFTGCAKEKIEDHFTVNALESIKYGETNRYSINFDISNKNITAVNKKNGEIIDLIREPFDQDNEICTIFVHEEWCYYLSRIPQIEGIRVFGIDMQNFEQKLIFNNVKENKEDFFGILYKGNAINNFSEKINTYLPIFCFFFNKEYIYYGINYQIIQINRTTGKETVVVSNILEWKPLFYHNGDIYYVDKQHRLSIFKGNDGRVHAVDSIYTDQFTIMENRIMYNDLLDNNKMYYYNIY